MAQLMCNSLSTLKEKKFAICQEQSINGGMDIPAPSVLQALDQLKEENRQLKAR